VNRGILHCSTVTALALVLSGCDAGAPVTGERSSAVEAAPAPAADHADDRCRLATSEWEGADCSSVTDADHDGVGDGEDRCPDTTPGVAVDASGCAAADRE
jgi:hypothetical protein